MKTFEQYLTEAKKTYKFKFGIAGELPEGFTDSCESCLQKFGLVNLTPGKKTPIQERPLDFPKLQNMETTYFEAELSYPTTAQVLGEYISQVNGIDPAYICLRDAEAPQEEYQDKEYVKVYEPKLGTEMESADPDAQKKVGDNRVMDLLKELEGVRKERDNDPGASSKPDTEQKHDMGETGKTSPVGSK
jgi:hypothetical protein|tara:strand:- start:182 stop:748 length:567 start_codon:yes stop_codon:yes gene_type:complete